MELQFCPFLCQDLKFKFPLSLPPPKNDTRQRTPQCGPHHTLNIFVHRSPARQNSPKQSERGRERPNPLPSSLRAPLDPRAPEAMGSLIKSLVGLFKGVKRPWQVRPRHQKERAKRSRGTHAPSAATTTTGRLERASEPTPPRHPPLFHTNKQTNRSRASPPPATTTTTCRPATTTARSPLGESGKISIATFRFLRRERRERTERRRRRSRNPSP